LVTGLEDLFSKVNGIGFHGLKHTASIPDIQSRTAIEEAQAFAERVLTLGRAHQEQGNEAYTLHLLGGIAAHRHLSEVAQAEDYYRQGLDLARELGMRPLLAHCHRGLGTLYEKSDRRAQARAALAVVIGLYRGMGMPFWLPEVEGLLQGMTTRGF
jgi:DNA-binding phage protein